RRASAVAVRGRVRGGGGVRHFSRVRAWRGAAPRGEPAGVWRGLRRGDGASSLVRYRNRNAHALTHGTARGAGSWSGDRCARWIFSGAYAGGRVMKRLLSRVAMAIIPLLAASSAHGHIVGARLGDFYSGALHPLTDLQDVLLWIALGLLAASLGASRSRWLVLVL